MADDRYDVCVDKCLELIENLKTIIVEKKPNSADEVKKTIVELIKAKEK